ncbi:unnamed protein product [Porites evermanni]|uniref:Ribosomal RNA-processing protein 42 n=1 Tax=Porites evermanni TaxID=104178 RepID=A0ABN8SSF7_9CNID|nr:unnamed protein product [Porites evermanni]
MADTTVSTFERAYIVGGIEQDFRSDGRSCQDYRHFEVETGIVSNTSGSARLRLSKTDVLVGVKAEIGEPRIQKPDQGYVEFFVDCSANASPEFEGRGGDELGAMLAKTLERAYNHKSAIDLHSLCILPGKQCWVLYIDALVLECGGNLFDSLSMAVKAALYNTRIPNVAVSTEEGEVELEISDDPHDCTRLDVSSIPLTVTMSKIGHRHVVDASLEEEACSLVQLLVSVNGENNICAMQKVGQGALDADSIFEMIETARSVGKKLNKELLKVLKKEESDSSLNKEKIGFLL